MNTYKLLIFFLINCHVAVAGSYDNQETSENLNAEAMASAEKQITFYPGYGYQKGDHWFVPLGLWISEELSFLRRGALKGARKIVQTEAEIESLSDDQKALFKLRAQDFLRDSESDEIIKIQFDKDPERQIYTIVDEQGNSETDRNGNIAGLLKISARRVEQLLVLQASDNGQLSFYAVSKNHGGRGKILLTAKEGLSIISDIDDTIKITEIPSGNKVVLRNTFFKAFEKAPGMLEMYQGFGKNTAFHYVSGGPWQLYSGLSGFLFEGDNQFPSGSMHMKNVRTNLTESDSFKDILKLIKGGATIEQKLEQISQIINHFPQREFILIGDSGEHDPEIFSNIKQKFSKQIKEIRIRDIINDKKCHPERLKGMTVISVNFSDAHKCS